MELGHAEVETTRRYLRQLINRMLKLEAVTAWNQRLDALAVDHA
jgi:hypothetical protein